MSSNPASPRVSIIIPSWTGDVGRVMRSIEQQTFRDYVVDVVRGVSPAARARNTGAQRAQGDILLFIDDDAYFGHDRVLEMLVAQLDQDPQTAVVGTSKLAPPASSPLQKAIARQVPRMVYPVVSRNVESNPPLDTYGFTAITTTCCAVRRSAFEEVGGFDENLTTGPEDTDFFYRMRREGYRVILAGRCWVYHDPPASLRDLLRKSFWYGVGHALEARKSPERHMDVVPLGRWYGIPAVIAALLGFPLALFVHYYFDPVRRLEMGFRPLKTLSTYAVLSGYVYGWYRGAPRVPARTYQGHPPASDGAAYPRNVLYIDAYPKIGGGQRVLYWMATRLTPGRYRPIVGLPPINPLRESLAEAGVRTVGIRFKESNYTLPSLLKPLTLLNSAINVPRVIRDIIRLARREQIDLIHANSAIAGIHALPAAIWLGIPCVVHAHDFNTAPFTNQAVLQMMRYKRAAMIFVARVLAVHYGVNKKTRYPYRVIYNGVDTQAYRPDPSARKPFLEELGIPEECFVIGAVGRLERWKGFDILVQAFALVAQEHPQARLVIVGDVVFDQLRSVKDDLLALVQTLGLDGKVIFTGFRADMPRVMAAIDMLAHAPIEREGFPMTLLEAMAASRPIVTVPAGGTVEQVFDGVNGLLAPAGDIPAIGTAMARLVADPELARRYGERGRRLVEERFSVEIQAAQVEQMYDRLLGQAAPQPVQAAEPLERIEVGSAVGS